MEYAIMKQGVVKQGLVKQGLVKQGLVKREHTNQSVKLEQGAMDLMKMPFVKPYNKINTLAKQTCLFIPKGPKYFACFTYLDNKPVCVFIDQDKKQSIHYVSFKEELCLGTLIYGTLIKNNFVCEHIYYYKNELVKEQLPILKSILESMIRDSEYLGSISFKLPHMVNQSYILECSNLPYTIYGILQGNNILVVQNILGGFQIKKRVDTEDVYELFVLNELNESVFYSTALVNDFKTSHFLKHLFYKRTPTYKSIEFSDSEEEEIIERDIYVGCLYISEFKKWKPYGIKPQDTLNKIHYLEKKIL